MRRGAAALPLAAGCLPLLVGAVLRGLPAPKFLESLELLEGGGRSSQYFAERASRVSEVDPAGGSWEPLNEQGYDTVAEHRSDAGMKVFIRRVLATSGRVVTDEGALTGFVPHYSGVETVQSFAHLQDELKDALWVHVIDSPADKAENQKNLFMSVAEAQGARVKQTMSKEPGSPPSIAPVQIPHRQGNQPQAAAPAAAAIPALPIIQRAPAAAAVPAAIAPPRIPPAVQEERVMALTPMPSASAVTELHREPRGKISDKSGAKAMEKATAFSHDILPGVQDMHSKASTIMSDFVAQAHGMRTVLLNEQATGKANLEKLRTTYLEKLQDAREQSRDLAASNEATKNKIAELTSSTMKLKQDAAKLQVANDILRRQLVEVAPKLDLVNNFLDETVNYTDESTSKYLEAMEKTTESQFTLEHYLDIARQELGIADSSINTGFPKSDLSLMVSMSKVYGKQSPEILSQAMMASIQNLRAVDRDGESKLTAEYQDLHDKEQARYDMLMNDGAALRQTKSKLELFQSQLEAAKVHLYDSLHRYQEKLEEVQGGMQRITHSVQMIQKGWAQTLVAKSRFSPEAAATKVNRQQSDESF